MAENRLTTISKADSDEKIGEFWDSHDFTEFDTDAPDADFEVISNVPVQLELLRSRVTNVIRKSWMSVTSAVCARQIVTAASFA